MRDERWGRREKKDERRRLSSHSFGLQRNQQLIFYDVVLKIIE
jgi:hypothetical protein